MKLKFHLLPGFGKEEKKTGEKPCQAPVINYEKKEGGGLPPPKRKWPPNTLLKTQAGLF